MRISVADIPKQILLQSKYTLWAFWAVPLLILPGLTLMAIDSSLEISWSWGSGGSRCFIYMPGSGAGLLLWHLGYYPHDFLFSNRLGSLPYMVAQKRLKK